MATKQIKFESFGEMIYYIFRKKVSGMLRKVKKIKKKKIKVFSTGEYRFGNLVKVSYY